MFSTIPVIDVKEIDTHGQLPELVHLNFTCPGCGHKFQIINFDIEIFSHYGKSVKRECNECASKVFSDH